jgi:hypothetical protein
MPLIAILGPVAVSLAFSAEPAPARTVPNAAAANAVVAKQATTELVTQRQPSTPLTPVRLSDGQPDVQGFFAPVKQGTYSLENPSNGGTGEVLKQRDLIVGGKPVPVWPSRIIDPPDGHIPYQPWAKTKQLRTQANIDYPTEQGHLDPQGRCFPDGVIRNHLWTGFQIQQFPGSVVIIFDQNHTYRVIPLDGRAHAPDAIKLWMSDSRGHWEGATLVVDVANSNAKSRLDNIGDFASDKVHVTERFTFTKEGIDWQATLTDPSVYTRPWTVQAQFRRDHSDEPGYEQWEQACHEGERNAEASLLPAKPVKAAAPARRKAVKPAKTASASSPKEAAHGAS